MNETPTIDETPTLDEVLSELQAAVHAIPGDYPGRSKHPRDGAWHGVVEHLMDARDWLEMHIESAPTT